MMHFVHAWNTAVEDSLYGNFNSVKMRIKFEKMEEKIDHLITVVKEQEEELGSLKKRNSTIDHGQLWLKRNIDESPSNDEGTIIFIPQYLSELCMNILLKYFSLLLLQFQYLN